MNPMMGGMHGMHGMGMMNPMMGGMGGMGMMGGHMGGMGMHGMHGMDGMGMGMHQQQHPLVQINDMSKRGHKDSESADRRRLQSDEDASTVTAIKKCMQLDVDVG